MAETADILLKIGTLDLSEYCDNSSLSINRTGVYSSGFTGMNGEITKNKIGNKYQISASFSDIPNDVKNQIENACNTDFVDITFGKTTAKFNGPDVNCSLSYETSAGVKIWNVSISTVCEFAPCGL
mgnify:CR=1 FL=1